MYDNTVITRMPIVFLLFLILGTPQALMGREQYPNTVEFWGGLAGWSGENASEFETGPSTGGTFLFQVGIPVQLGLDVAFARMDTEQIVGEVDEFSASGAARYRIALLEEVRPFLGIRCGYTRLSADYWELRFEQNGVLAGGNLGLEIPLGSRLMLVGTAEALYYSYWDTTVFLEDIPVPSTGGTAWRYWGRLGLSFRWRS